MFGPMNFRFGRRWVQDVLAEASTSIDISGSRPAIRPTSCNTLGGRIYMSPGC